VQPDQVDHALEELQQRLRLTDASSDDDTAIAGCVECFSYPTLSCVIEGHEALVGHESGLWKASQTELKTGANFGCIDARNGVWV
jgi:hypothetical protein